VVEAQEGQEEEGQGEEGPEGEAREVEAQVGWRGGEEGTRWHRTRRAAGEEQEQRTIL